MEGKIYIDGEFGKEITLESVRNSVLALGDIKILRADFNSGGGDVNVGYAVQDYFKELKKSGITVHTNIVGLCASIATAPFLEGEERTMSSSSTLMIHNPWMQPNAPMEAKDLEAAGVRLRGEEEKLANIYADKVDTDIEEIKELMKLETRMDLTQSRNIGFINAKSIEYRICASIKPIVNKKDMNKNEGLLKDIKALLDKVSGKEEPVQAMAITLEDGSTVFIDSEDGEFVGKSIFLEEGGEALADGSYMLEDGRELDVAEGKVSEIKEASAPNEEAEALAKENAELKAELETLKASAVESASALEESKEINAKLDESVKEIVAKVEALEVENKAMASVTVGGKDSVKAAVKTPEVKKEESGIASGLAGFLKLKG